MMRAAAARDRRLCSAAKENSLAGMVSCCESMMKARGLNRRKLEIHTLWRYLETIEVDKEKIMNEMEHIDIQANRCTRVTTRSVLRGDQEHRSGSGSTHYLTSHNTSMVRFPRRTAEMLRMRGHLDNQ